MAPPDFGRSVNPISTRGGRVFPSNYTGTPGISDLPTALKKPKLFTIKMTIRAITIYF
jgi:hypothetical protein